MQLKIEREALRKETDQASRQRLEKLEDEVSDLEIESQEMTAKWKAEKSKVGAAAASREALDRLRGELEQAQRRGDLARASEILYGQIPIVERELAEAEGAEKPQDQLAPEVVDAEQIAQVVSRWTGVQVERMLEGERDKLLRMEDVLRGRVVGQEEALVAVSDAVRRARAGLQDPQPADRLVPVPGAHGRRQDRADQGAGGVPVRRRGGGDPARHERVHGEALHLALMIGAPPGYVGYDEGGALTEAVRRRPYQVVLFDEVEKAHPDVFNVLLQVLDDGRLTGRAGQDGGLPEHPDRDDLQPGVGGPGQPARRRGRGDRPPAGHGPACARHFRPEFLNRIDEIILFQRLGRAQMDSIVSIQLQRVEKMLGDRHMAISLDPGALHWLGEKGYDPVYGARPLKRVIQKELIDPIARKLLSGDLADGSVIDVHAGDGRLEIGRGDDPVRRVHLPS